MTNSGTATIAPVSSVAGFVTFETVSPLMPGSVSVTVSSTDDGSWMPGRLAVDGQDLHGRRRQDVLELVRDLGSWKRELLVGLLVHEVRLGAVVVEELDVLRLGVHAGELLAGAERVVDTAPVSRFFSFVRTNAPPLPGFTCWKSMIRHIEPRCSMCIPVLNWFVETMSAMRAGGYLLAAG